MQPSSSVQTMTKCVYQPPGKQYLEALRGAVLCGDCFAVHIIERYTVVLLLRQGRSDCPADTVVVFGTEQQFPTETCSRIN